MFRDSGLGFGYCFLWFFKKLDSRLRGNDKKQKLTTKNPLSKEGEILPSSAYRFSPTIRFKSATISSRRVSAFT